MTLNNSKSVINLKIARRAALILFAAYLVLVYAANLITFPILGVGRTGWTLLFLFCFLAIIFLPVILNYQYIFYSDEGDNIIIRYYDTGFIEGNKNSIEISKKSFSGFRIEKSFFGLSRKIILYQNVKQKIAKYPPVYINALKRDDKVKILRSLGTFAPQVKGETPAI